jgi:hypothetical protein
VELLACLFVERVETRSWRLLRPAWLCPRILPADRVRSERLFAALLPLSAGRILNLLNHALDLMAVLLGGEVLPAGQGYQDERLGFLEVLRPTRLASLLRQVFCRPIDPDPFQRRAGEEGWGGMDAGPLAHAGNEISLTPFEST